MPRSNDPYDLINALENKYRELTANSDITAADEFDDELDDIDNIEDDNPEVTKLWDEIVQYNIATDEELSLVTGICGYSIETLNDVIHVRTGYDDIDTYIGEVYPE